MVSYVFVRVMTMSRIKMSPFHASLQKKVAEAKEKEPVIDMGSNIKITPSLCKLDG
jgi:hypothetical protein